jgi:hypothetical protein
MRPRALGRTAAILVAAIGAVGCGTARPARDLATVTAGNVSIVNTQLRAFARESLDVATERQVIIRELDEWVTDGEKELRFKQEAMKLARDTDKLRLVDQLDGLLEMLAELDRDADGRRAALQKQIAASHSPLALPVNPLTSVEGALIDLGRDDTTKEILAFYRGFIGQVVANMQAATTNQAAARDKAVAGAKAAAAEVKKSLAKGRDDLNP